MRLWPGFELVARCWMGVAARRLLRGRGLATRGLARIFTYNRCDNYENYTSVLVKLHGQLPREQLPFINVHHYPGEPIRILGLPAGALGDVIVGLHLPFCLAGMYLLLRKFGTQPEFAALEALSLAGSGYFLTAGDRVHFTMRAQTAATLIVCPLTLLHWHLMVDSKRLDLQKVDGVILGLPVPSSTRDLELRYVSAGWNPFWATLCSRSRSLAGA